MRSIRAGRGLGDSLYLQAVVRHLIRRDGKPLKVCSDWPDLFRPHGEMAKVVPFTRAGVDIIAHYSMRKGFTDTNQFQDCCLQAGIKEPVELKIDWTPTDFALLDKLRSHNLPIVCVQLPRNPMGRVDGFGAELLPDCSVIQKCIDQIKGKALVVQVGAGKPLYRFQGIDIDLANETTISQLLDVASISSAFLGYVSFLLPLAESFGKPAMMVWSKRGLKSQQLYVRQITPHKACHAKTTINITDNSDDGTIRNSVEAFLQSVGSVGNT